MLTYHARDLAANPSKRVRLEGHADERGTREYNLALGERRANGILNYLIVNGAARSQIEVVSYGEERPADRSTGDAAYQRNRRVEIVDPDCQRHRLTAQSFSPAVTEDRPSRKARPFSLRIRPILSARQLRFDAGHHPLPGYLQRMTEMHESDRCNKCALPAHDSL